MIVLLLLKAQGSIPGWGAKIPQATWYDKTENQLFVVVVILLAAF